MAGDVYILDFLCLRAYRCFDYGLSFRGRDIQPESNCILPHSHVIDVFVFKISVFNAEIIEHDFFEVMPRKELDDIIDIVHINYRFSSSNVSGQHLNSPSFKTDITFLLSTKSNGVCVRATVITLLSDNYQS